MFLQEIGGDIFLFWNSMQCVTKKMLLHFLSFMDAELEFGIQFAPRIT